MLKVGSKVQIKSLKKSGIILELKGQKASIAIKNFTIQASLNDLELLSNKSKSSPKSFASKTSVKNKSKTIDYHRKTVKEMLTDLEEQINLAYQNKTSSLEVITGRGTGRLKAAVLEYLNKSDLRLNYQVGLNNEYTIYIYL